MKCNFCEIKEAKEIFLNTKDFFALLDRAPVTEGHTIIISNRHVAEPFSLNAEEWKDLQIALQKTKAYLDEKYAPDGYNIGVNSGEAAGQTVQHLHVHVIPRHAGDVENPRGGVRNLMKPIEELWD